VRAMSEHRHQTHPDLIKRLQRANGHLQKVIGMLEQGRECGDIAQQLHAVEKSVSAAKKLLIHDHLDHCLEHAVQGTPREQKAALAEVRDITKYL